LHVFHLLKNRFHPWALRPLALGPGVWLVLVFLFAPGVAAADSPVWDPAKTWVFAVSAPCPERPETTRANLQDLKDRQDTHLIQTFRDREVPDDHIAFLKDEEAVLANIRKEFKELLAKTEEGDFLIFFYEGHGGGSPVVFGDNNDNDLPATEIFETIEKHFHGSGVLLLCDCCCSGGLAVEARRRDTKLTCACLTSTYALNPSGGWTFCQALAAGFRGDPMVDLDGDGTITLDEIQLYVEMACAYAEGCKAVYETFNDFDDSLQIASEVEKSNPRLGTFVEVEQDEVWYQAQVIEFKDDKFRVAYLGYDETEWVTGDRIRDFEPHEFEEGTEVLARHPDPAKQGRWYKAVVKEARLGLHFVEFVEDEKPDGLPHMWLPANCIKERPDE
jgi:hypothetical protein